jgi:predicted helicase
MAKIFHSSLHGLSKIKDRVLLDSDIDTTEWSNINLEASDFYLLIPQGYDGNLREEYKQGWKITDIFSQNGDPAPGLITTHDEFAISRTKDEAIEKVEAFLNTNTEVAARSIFKLCSTDQWQYERAKKELADRSWHKELKQILYRPFDLRWTIYNRNVTVHRRERVMNHMITGDNLGLSICRQTVGGFWQHSFVTNDITDDCYISNKTRERTYLLPLYLYPNTLGEIEMGITRKPNIAPEFLTKLEQNFGYTPTPEAIFHYIYAIFHCPEYRSRYAEFLKGDFPRVPLTRNVDRFRQLGELGEKLVNLHLMKSPILNETSSPFIDNGGGCIVDAGHPKYESGKVVINKQKDYFMDVPEDVWNFHVGGYQVCQKWLKDRKGRTLSQDDIRHYQKIVVALGQSIELMAKIDAAIPNWPLDAEYN